MKSKKNKWLRFCNRMLSALLVVLGFGGCSDSEEEILVMYGSPTANYEIKGKVQNEAQQALENIRVIVSSTDKSGAIVGYRPADTLYTNKEGAYQMERKNVLWNYYQVAAEDTSDVYAGSSVNVEMKPTGGEGWYLGSDSKEVNFTLKKKQ